MRKTPAEHCTPIGVLNHMRDMGTLRLVRRGRGVEYVAKWPEAVDAAIVQQQMMYRELTSAIADRLLARMNQPSFFEKMLSLSAVPVDLAAVMPAQGEKQWSLRGTTTGRWR